MCISAAQSFREYLQDKISSYCSYIQDTTTTDSLNIYNAAAPCLCGEYLQVSIMQSNTASNLSDSNQATASAGPSSLSWLFLTSTWFGTMSAHLFWLIPLLLIVYAYAFYYTHNQEKLILANTQLRAKLTALTDKSSELESSNTALATANTDLESLHRAREAELHHSIQDLHTQYELLHSSVEDLTQHTEHLQQDNFELVQYLEDLQDRNASIEAENVSWRATLRALEASRADAQTAAEALRGQLAAKEFELGNVLSASRARIAELDEQKAGITKVGLDLHRRCVRFLEEREGLEWEVAWLRYEVDEMGRAADWDGEGGFEGDEMTVVEEQEEEEEEEEAEDIGGFVELDDLPAEVWDEDEEGFEEITFTEDR